MDVRRDAIDRLERAGIRSFVTGSEALAILGVAFRATNDIDLVIDLVPAAWDTRVRPAFEPDYLVNDLLRVSGKWLGSAIRVRQVGKVDLVVRDRDAWGTAAFSRRVRVDDPGLGPVWVSTAEDLLLAKLEFADGDASGLQARDRLMIVRSFSDLDLAYVDRHAAALGLSSLLAEVLDRAG